MTVAVKPGALATISSVDVLDHLLAPLVLEIDVDVGRLAPFGGDETLEQEIDLLGIDLGDAEAITDDGIRRRAASLAKNAFRSRKAHDVVDGQEVRRVFELGGDGELFVERFLDILLHAVRITALRALLHQRDQCVLRRGEALAGFFRIFRLPQLVEREAAAARGNSTSLQSLPAPCGKAAPSPAAISDAVRHWLQAGGRLLRSSRARGCKSRHPATAAVPARGRARRSRRSAARTASSAIAISRDRRRRSSPR